MPQNFTRTGDITDYYDPDKILLTVDGDDIDLSNPKWLLEEYTVSYDGKTLTFGEIPTGSQTFGEPTYAPEQVVTLSMDLDGDGLVTYFRGRIKKVEHRGKTQDEGVTYTAWGYQMLADEVDAIGETGLPNILFPNFSWSVAWMIEYVFDWNGTRLTDAGLGATVGTPGFDAFVAYSDENVSLQNLGVTSALKKLCAFEANRRVIWNDANESWLFPRIDNATIEDISIDSYNYKEATFAVDLSNRYTSLIIYGPFPYTATYSTRQILELTQGWDTGFQADWTIRRAQGLDGADEYGTAYAWVFRRWTFSTGTLPKAVPGSARLTVLIGWDEQLLWMHVDADINWKLGEVIARVPVVIDGNPEHPGRAIGPLDAVITYLDADLASLEGLAFIQSPGSGYTGTAYSEYGVERQKLQMVDTAQLTSDNATAMLSLLKDAIITAEIPIVGDPLKEFINLQKRVRISHPTKTTGMENLAGLVMKYTHKFGKPGLNTISVTTDRSTYTRVR